VFKSNMQYNITTNFRKQVPHVATRQAVGFAPQWAPVRNPGGVTYLRVVRTAGPAKLVWKE